MTAPSVDVLRNDVDEIVRRIRPDFKGEIKESDRLREDLGLDSLHSMKLLSAITEKYKLNINIKEVQEVKTVEDVVKFLQTTIG